MFLMIWLVIFFSENFSKNSYLWNRITEGPENAGPPPGQPGQPGQHGQPTQIPLTAQQLQELNTFTASPMFQQFRLQAMQNPDIIPQMITYVQQNHPNIHQLLMTNPNLMFHLLVHGRPNVIGAPGQQGGPMPPGTSNPPGQPQVAPPQPPAPPVQPTIELSEDDHANIQTIMEMGFTQEQAIEAYLVCNKNVELAINYLFDQN